MGTLRIDHLMVTAPLLPHIVNIRYEEVNAGISSDHRDMFMDIQRQAITNHALAPRRTLQADHHTNVTSYRKKLYTYCNKYQILLRLQRLEKSSADNSWLRHWD